MLSLQSKFYPLRVARGATLERQNLLSKDSKFFPLRVAPLRVVICITEKQVLLCLSSLPCKNDRYIHTH